MTTCAIPGIYFTDTTVIKAYKIHTVHKIVLRNNKSIGQNVKTWKSKNTEVLEQHTGNKSLKVEDGT